MATLKIPRNPSDILSCSRNVLMRVTKNDEPGVAMLLSGCSAVLFVSKDGVLQEFGISAYRLKFVDYLTQDESITIFGDAGERTEEDVAVPILPDIAYIAYGDFAEKVPDFIPFRAQFDNASAQVYEMMWVPTTDGQRISLSFWPDGRRSWGSPTGSTNLRLFRGYLEDPSIERWRSHPQRLNHNVVDVSQWPT